MENLQVEPLVPDFREGLFEVRLTGSAFVISQLSGTPSLMKWVKLDSDRLEPTANAAYQGFTDARLNYLGMVSDKYSNFPAGQLRHYVANLSAQMRRDYEGDLQGEDNIARYCSAEACAVIEKLAREVSVSDALVQLVNLGLEPKSRLEDLEHETQLQFMASLAWKHCLASPDFIVHAKVGLMSKEEFAPAAASWIAAAGNEVLQHMPEVSMSVGRELLAHLVDAGRDQGGLARPFANYRAGTALSIPFTRLAALCPGLVADPEFPQDLLPAVQERMAILPLAHRSEFIRAGVPYVIEMHGEYDFADGERDLYRFATDTETSNYLFTAEAMAEEAGHRSRHSMRLR